MASAAASTAEEIKLRVIYDAVDKSVFSYEVLKQLLSARARNTGRDLCIGQVTSSSEGGSDIRLGHYRAEHYPSMGSDEYRNTLYARLIEAAVRAKGCRRWLEVAPGLYGTLTRVVLASDLDTTVLCIEAAEEVAQALRSNLGVRYSRGVTKERVEVSVNPLSNQESLGLSRYASSSSVSPPM